MKDSEGSMWRRHKALIGPAGDVNIWKHFQLCDLEERKEWQLQVLECPLPRGSTGSQTHFRKANKNIMCAVQGVKLTTLNPANKSGSPLSYWASFLMIIIIRIMCFYSIDNGNNNNNNSKTCLRFEFFLHDVILSSISGAHTQLLSRPRQLGLVGITKSLYAEVNEFGGQETFLLFTTA